MPPTPVPSQVTWTAGVPVRQLDTSQPGVTAYVYTVPFTTGNGASGSVNVPENRIGDVPYVRSLIAGLAAQLDPIVGMTSQSG